MDQSAGLPKRLPSTDAEPRESTWRPVASFVDEVVELYQVGTRCQPSVTDRAGYRSSGNPRQSCARCPTPYSIRRYLFIASTCRAGVSHWLVKSVLRLTSR